MRVANPHQTSIILRGGPLHGATREIDDFIVGYGRFFVPVPSAEPQPMGDLGEYPKINLEVATYERTLCSDGRIGTCEARFWYEWRYAGSEWR